MESMESSTCVPPGFRFHPTDEELVGYYLKKKVASQKIDLDVIRDIDLYRIEPWDLIERCRIGYEEQSEWYFFSHKDKKYPTGTRTNRATLAGFWKATGRDKAVYDKTKLIGMRKTLVFYKGRAPNGQKTDWIMHEYRLESDENGPPQEEGWVVCRAFKKKTTVQSSNANHNNNKANNIETCSSWDSPYTTSFYEEPTTATVVGPLMIDPTTTPGHHPGHYQLLPRHHPAAASPSFIQSAQNPTTMTSKQEIMIDHRAANSNKITTTDQYSSVFIHSSDDHPFLQLPQLESPSVLPSLKRPNNVINSISGFLSSSDHHQTKRNNRTGTSSRSNNYNDQYLTGSDRVTDWRALDKFVASQLSHDDTHQQHQPDHHHHHNQHHGGISSSIFGESQEIIPNNSLDIALLLLQGKQVGLGIEEEEDEDDEEDEEDSDKLINGFLAASTSSTTESDFGICIFDK